MLAGDVIKAAWQGVRAAPFSPQLLTSRRNEIKRQRKLIRYCLAMELGWSNYAIAKAEVEAGNFPEGYDWRQRFVKGSISTIEKSQLATEEYRAIRLAVAGDTKTMMDKVAELLDERPVTLASALVLLCEKCTIEPEVLAEVMSEARTVKVQHLRIQ